MPVLPTVYTTVPITVPGTDQVDLFVNGKCIARGEVVVIEDNFGVRITEIVQAPGIEMLAGGK